MSDNRKRILEMLEAGKISTDEAMKLLSALENNEEGGKVDLKKKIRYLRVLVDSPHGHDGEGPGKVNVRIPVSLIRAGMKFTSLLPEDASRKVEEALSTKGFNVNLKNIKEEDIEELIEALRELEVDVDDGKAKVRVYAE